MKVSIRLSTDTLYTVTIPDNSTVDDLKTAALVAAPMSSLSQGTSPSNYKLIFGGQKLELNKSLQSYNITTESTVILMNSVDSFLVPSIAATGSENAITNSISSISKPRRKSANKRKCSFTSCSSAPLRMVGDCQFCEGKFCAKHRLLEDHNCNGLQSCKDELHERNATKLQSEQTISSKV